MVLALAWAVYLIPKALRHHDEIARTRSIDRFSTAMRVLARREPVNRRDTRLVVTPPRPRTPRMLVPTQSAVAVDAVASSPQVSGQEVRRDRARRTAGPVTAQGPVTQVVDSHGAGSQAPGSRAPGSQRAAARAAARRRRHILTALLLVVVVVVVAAALGYLPWWSVSVPATLTLGYLFLCRFQVNRARRTPVATAADESTTLRRPAVRVEAPYGTAQGARNAQGFEEVAADEDTVTLSALTVAAALAAGSVTEADAAAVDAAADAAEAAALTAAATDSGSLWDPLPMTLPTYVGKARATRTVRTIDLTEPGSWSSGRSEADSELVEETAAAQENAAREGVQTSPQDDVSQGGDEQRAVGS